MHTLRRLLSWIYHRPRASGAALEARRRASQAVNDANQMRPVVDTTMAYIRSETARNHFTEEMARLFRGGV